LDSGLFNPSNGLLKISVNGVSHIDLLSTAAIQAKRQLRVPSGAPSGGDGATNAGYSFDNSGDTGFFREENTGSAGGSIVHRIDGVNCFSTSGQQTLSNNKIFARSTVSGSSWDNSVLVLEHASSNQPQIGFHAPSNSAAGAIKFFGQTQLFELRNGNDSGFGTWHNNSISSIVETVSGGNETDISTNPENRLDYSFVAQNWMSGKFVVSAVLTFVKYSPGQSEGIAFIRLYDVTTGILVADGPISRVSLVGEPTVGLQSSVIFNKTTSLVAGRTYRVELQIYKTTNGTNATLTSMSLSCQIT
jgi:hypothetical protein